MPKSQVLHRKAKGLYSSFNPHQVPEGALVEAKNVFINRENIISKARGVDRYGAVRGSEITQIMEFKDRLILHSGTGLYYDSDGAGTWTQWTGTFSAPDSSTKLRGVEARSNLWFTTSNGPYRNDELSGTPREAGIPPGLCINPDAWSATTTGGWLTSGYYVAYKYVFVREDANGRLLFSEPSDRWIYYNDNVAAVAVGFEWLNPTAYLKSASPGDKIYIYRSYEAPTVTDLEDKYFFVTAKDYNSSTLQTHIYDSLPEVLLGTELYTNPTQEGAENANRRPPFAKDIALYKGYMFYANVRQPVEIKLRLVEDSANINNGDTITVTRGTDTDTYTFGTSPGAPPETKRFTTGTASENIEDTMRFLAHVISERFCDEEVPFYAKYTSDATDFNGAPGEITITLYDYGTQDISVQGSSNLDEFFEPDIYSAAATASQKVEKNVLYHSKFEEPNAVPIGNFDPVGSEDSEILRILPLRNSLIILKEEGVWRLTGDTEADFVIEEYDPTVRIDAPETAVVLNNAVYCSSNQGVVRIDESMGVVILSRPIENDLKSLQAMSNYSAEAHACAYESERQYWLWLPDASTDTYAKTAWVYNYITKSWTQRTKDCSSAKVLHDNKTLYLAHAVDYYILEERKSLSGSADFVDEEMDTTVSAIGTATDSDGNTVRTVTCSFSYTPATLGVGWLFTYTTEESVVEAAVDNGDGTYTITLAHNLSLPNPSGGGGGGDGSWFDLFHMQYTGGLLGAGAGSPYTAQLSIPILSEVTWAPEAAGNAATMKQFSACQVEVEENQVYKQELEFINNYFRAVSASNVIRTPGWGTGRWGSPTWGSSPPSVPVRTYVPQGYQRCQWLRATFRHRYAKEYFDIVNLGLTLRVTSDRTVVTK